MQLVISSKSLFVRHNSSSFNTSCWKLMKKQTKTCFFINFVPSPENSFFVIKLVFSAIHLAFLLLPRSLFHYKPYIFITKLNFPHRVRFSLWNSFLIYCSLKKLVSLPKSSFFFKCILFFRIKFQYIHSLYNYSSVMKFDIPCESRKLFSPKKCFFHKKYIFVK